MDRSINSTKDILKSTGIIGGSKILSILINIAQTKIVALLIGPVGLGIVSLFFSTISLLKGIFQVGIPFSAVRTVSEVKSTNDSTQVGRTISVIRGWVITTGIIGFFLAGFFAGPLSTYTFGNQDRIWEFTLLSLIILFDSIEGGNTAIFRGLRMIKILAKMNIYKALLGFVIAIPAYYVLEENGIILVFVLGSLSSLIISSLFLKYVPIKRIAIGFNEGFYKGVDMLKLGFFTLLTGLITTSTMYYVRMFIAKESDLEAVGFYAAATSLSVTYLNLLLESMGMDYFPRLSQIHNNNPSLVRLVNEQTLITINIGTPLIMAMFLFSELLITVMYSSGFLGAVLLLKWMLLGIFLRLIMWPIGYVFLAKAKGNIFLFTQASWNVLFISIISLGWSYVGLEIVGIAFAVSYVVMLLVNFFLIVKTISFSYTKNVSKLILVMSGMVMLSCFSSIFLSAGIGYFINALLLVACLAISYSEIDKIYSIKSLLSTLFNKKN